MSELRLIDANKLERWLKTNMANANPLHCDIKETYSECITMVHCMETVDAVPREEYESLLKRFRHLLESDYIRSFDEKIPLSGGKHKRDIREADRENRHGRWINECHGYRNCSECGCEYPLEDAKGFSLEDDYCPDCGARMDGGAE